jgi:hypothetical protein
MKRALFTLVLMVSTFLLGWFVHLGFTYDPHSGLQWQFVDAAQRGDVGSLERYFQQGASIDAIPSYRNGAVSGFPALWCAAHAGQPDSVEWLLKHGANPNQKIVDSWPLAAAEWRVIEAVKTVEILKKHGAKNLYPQ